MYTGVVSIGEKMKSIVVMIAAVFLLGACSKGGAPRQDDPLATPEQKEHNERMRERDMKAMGDPILRATGGDSILNNAGPP